MKITAGLFFFLILAVATVKSQENTINEFVSIRYDKSFQVGALKHSNGIGLSLQYMVQRKVNRNILFNFEVFSLKNPKESKVQGFILK